MFGAARVDGVEINPIIANDVMRGRFRDFSGGIYTTSARARSTVDDGRSFVRRTPERYDVIQASLVDTWAATAAGAYTLTENTLYTVEAFNDYLDHLTDGGMLTITRWVFDGLRLVSLAQEACDARGWMPRSRLAIVQHERVATFLLKKSPFTAAEIATLREVAERLGFTVLYAPGRQPPAVDDGRQDPGRGRATITRGLIVAPDRERFYDDIPAGHPTDDRRPSVLLPHDEAARPVPGRLRPIDALRQRTERAADAHGHFRRARRAVRPRAAAASRSAAAVRGWRAWLAYFGALGAGFMLIEVTVLQRFVLLLGHPVYSLTVTLFSLLLGTGLGAALSRRISDRTIVRTTALTLGGIIVIGLVCLAVVTPLIVWAVPFSRGVRIGIAIGVIVPFGMVLGIPMPAGIRLLRQRAPQMVTWAWGMNGALSVVGGILAIFIAMNWGFQVTMFASAAAYLVGLAALLVASR